ncbi:MAG: hypothetical protein FD143_3548, partial [Ignavibacteria bacterium]
MGSFIKKVDLTNIQVYNNRVSREINPEKFS